MRSRLRIGVSVFLTGSLLAFGILVYGYFSVQLTRGQEHRLFRWSVNILTEISRNPTRFQADPQRYLFATTSNEFTSGGVLVQFMSPDGELMARSPSLINVNLPFSLGDDDVVKDVEINDGTRLKVYQRLIIVDNQVLGYVVLGIATTQSFHNLDILRNILIVMTILTVVVLGATINAIVTHNIMANHRRFLSFASHELRTPLSVIIGNAELALKHGDPAQYQNALQTVRDQADWMNRLVSNLLFIFRTHAGSEMIQASICDVAEIVAEEVQFLKSRYPSRTVVVQFATTAEWWADADRLRQVIRNMLDNAAKYTADSGKIDIKMRTDSEFFELTIQDNGRGIDAAVQQRIFDAYYRLDYTETDGVGLGMAIVKSIIDAHHGTIIVDSNLGIGTQITVRLPRKRRRSRLLGWAKRLGRWMYTP